MSAGVLRFRETPAPAPRRLYGQSDQWQPSKSDLRRYANALIEAYVKTRLEQRASTTRRSSHGKKIDAVRRAAAQLRQALEELGEEERVELREASVGEPSLEEIDRQLGELPHISEVPRLLAQIGRVPALEQDFAQSIIARCTELEGAILAAMPPPHRQTDSVFQTLIVGIGMIPAVFFGQKIGWPRDSGEDDLFAIAKIITSHALEAAGDPPKSDGALRNALTRFRKRLEAVRSRT